MSEVALLRLLSTLASPSGVILITGPAGAGKTTTAYACLRSILRHSEPRSIVTLEDPVETELGGVDQSQIDPSNGYDWPVGMKALLRQDPEVMLVGEIRDPATAAIVFQAAMTGQLVLSTMHARGAADALRRLLDMGVPSHHLRSGLDLLLCQRLVSRLCHCIQVASDQRASPCATCGGSRQDGRLLLTEILPTIQGDLASAIVQDADTRTLQRTAESMGMENFTMLTETAVRNGLVSRADLATDH